MTPLLEPDVAGGQIVVTRFDCGGLVNLVTLLVVHQRLKLDVRRQANGFVGVRTIVDWRRRSFLSISLWADLDSVYSMGGVPRHVTAARLPGQLGVATTCGVFCFVGDWRRVMFRSPVPSHSPLHPEHP
ncbi:MAG TPA: hypothetical protein VF755_04370 [Catenuloplanes sp.]|jgi:hypothetical protein